MEVTPRLTIQFLKKKGNTALDKGDVGAVNSV